MQLPSLPYFILTVSGLTCLLYQNYAPHLQHKNSPIENHKYHIIKDIFTDQEFEQLQRISKKITYKMTTRADEDFGADDKSFGSSPISEEGKCEHMLQIPNVEKTRCNIPARIDVGKQFLITGGFGVRKEKYEDLVPRATIFQHFFPTFLKTDNKDFQQIQRVFNSKVYSKNAQDICSGCKIIDPTQLSFLINVPGQEVGIHYDTPWFINANRLYFPLWLLVCMERSKLYKDMLLKQTQGLTYLHSWTNYAENQGGLYLYPKGPGQNVAIVNAVANQAILMDGTSCAHGTQPFKPKAESPRFQKNTDYTMAWNGTYWQVFDEEEKITKVYEEDDVRITMVWRQQCFKDEAQKTEFQQGQQLKVRDVIEQLKENLIQKGVVKSFPKSEIETAKILVDNYAKYPWPKHSYFPYNYCLLDKVLGDWIDPLLNLIC